MKIILITFISALVIFILAQVIIGRSTRQTESHSYKVIKDFKSFEIRQYDAALFSYIKMPYDNYENSSGKGFRQLAGYIFGGNDKNEKIAMTTPVAMTVEDSVVMKFMIPRHMNLSDMPGPNNPNIKFKKEEEKTMAAISFSGWASDPKISEYTEKLKNLLSEEQILYKGPFSFLGYNPPYEVLNRKNEIVVEVEFKENQP